MKEYLNTNDFSFYIPMFRDLIVLIGLIIGVINYKKKDPINYFIFYLGYSFFISIFEIFALEKFNTNKNIYKIWISFNYFLLFIEPYVYISYLKKILHSNFSKSLFSFFMVVYTPLFLLLHILDIFHSGRGTWESIIKLHTLEGLLILITAIYFFIRLFKKSESTNLINEPSFWIYTGITFTFVLILPTLSLLNYLKETNINFYNLAYAFYSLIYSLNVLLIIRAFLCKPVITK